jgi:hypothetical protein
MCILSTIQVPLEDARQNQLLKALLEMKKQVRERSGKERNTNMIELCLLIELISSSRRGWIAIQSNVSGELLVMNAVKK